MIAAKSVIENEPLTGWLEGLPPEWDAVRLRRLFHVENGSTPSSQEPAYWGGDIPWVTPNDFDERTYSVSEGDRFLTDEGLESCGATLVPPGSLILSTRAPIGYVAIAASALSTNQGCRALIPKEGVEERYYRYVLEAARPMLQVLGQGATFNELSGSDLAGFWLPLPPTSEQNHLSDFLDEKTTRIDKIIRDKERLIERLEERRLALIYEAVTGSWTDETETFQPSADWIRQLPSHWVMSPVFARFEVQLGKMLNQEAASGEHQAPYLRNVDVRWGRVDVEDLPTMSFEPHEREKYELQPRDILVCEGGEVGRTAVWCGELDECYYQKALHRVRPRDPDRDIPRFFYYLMRAAATCGVFSAEGDTSTITHLTAEKLRRLRFPFPPVDEQREIVKRLDAQVAELDRIVSDLQAQVAHLEEYRASLITAAVTGQLDVVTSDSVAA